MRINVYSEELTDRVEKITKTVDGVVFYGIRFYLYLPVTTKPIVVATGSEYPPYHKEIGGGNIQGPFIHREGDDDSSAITFWSTSRENLSALLMKALELVSREYANGER